MLLWSTHCTATPRLCRSSLLVPLTCRAAYFFSLSSVIGVNSTSAGMVRNGTAEAAGMVLQARFSADSTSWSLEGHGKM